MEKNMRRVYPFIFIIIFILKTVIYAADPNVSVSISDEKIGINETTTIIITVSDQQVDSIEDPQSDQYRLQYSSMSFSYGSSSYNGQTTSSTATYSYSYTLTPKEKGTIHIDGFRVYVGKKTYTTEDLTLEVVEEDQKTAGGSRYFNPWSMLDEYYGRNNKDTVKVYLQIYIDNKSPLQNEQIGLEAWMYSTDPSTMDAAVKRISDLYSDKLIKYEVTDYVDTESVVTQEFDGETYYGKLLDYYVAYPIDSGWLGVAAPKYIAVTENRKMELSADNFAINSAKLDESSGLDYIGDLSVTRNISTNLTMQGSIISVELEMIGDGNLKVFSDPYENVDLDGIFISKPNTDIEFYEMTNGKIYFKQTVEYSVLAQNAGEYAVPAVILDYYENDGEIAEKSIKLNGFKITVLPESLALINLDELPLRIIDKLIDFKFIMLKPIYWVLFILILIAPIAAKLIGIHLSKMESDREYSRKFLANTRLSRYLSEANRYLQEKKYRDFYVALQKGIFYYITDKLNIPAGLGIKELTRKLEERGIAQELIAQVNEVYGLCGYYAYSGQPSEEKTEQLLSDAKRIFDTIR